MSIDIGRCCKPLRPDFVAHLIDARRISNVMPQDQYTVIVSGQRFIFTRDQLESEPGNYFEIYFLGDFQEATEKTRELNLEKDPLLFTLIQAHLRGYDPLPIPDSFVPVYMTKEGALKNLLHESEFFGLTRLEGLIREEMNATKEREKGSKVPGQRIYQFWYHTYHSRISAQHAAIEGYGRTYVPVSREGVEKMHQDHDNVLTDCELCTQITPGWELVLLLRAKGTTPTEPRLHYVVESKPV